MNDYIIRGKLILCIMLMTLLPAVCRGEGRLFRQIPDSDGINISESTVYDIKRSPEGFVWIASDEGLFRFDGEHTVRIPLSPDEKDPVPIRSIAPFRGGGLIIGTSTGIYKLTVNHDKYDIRSLLEGKPFSATCGVTTASGDAIIGGDDGLVIYSPDTDKTQTVKLSGDVLNQSNSVIDMAQSPNAVYALTKGGIFRLDKLSRSVVPVNAEEEIGNLSPISLACSANRLFIGTSGDGLLSLNPANGKVERTNYVNRGNVVTSLDVSEDLKSLFIGTDGGGVTKVDLETGKTSSHRHNSSDKVSPSSNQVYSLLADAEGLLWIGYYQHGVDYTPESVGPFELYDNPVVFNSRGIPVRAITIDDDFNAIGTREGVVVHDKVKDEAWEVGTPQLRSEMVISLLSKGGKIFVGTYGGGLQLLDPVTHTVTDFSLAKDDPVFRNGHVFALATDRNGAIWAGTNDGLYQFESTGKVSHFTSYLTALPSGNVYGIFFDSEGKGWICTDTGVCVYDPERRMLRTDLFPVSFPKDTRFRSVYEDSRHRLYFVPESGYVYSCGLDFSNPSTLDYPLLRGSDAKSIVEDSFGDLWIATNRGIFRTDSTGHTVRFGLSAGMPSLSFLQAQPLADNDGGIWLGNAEGLLKLNESRIETSVNCQRPPVPTKVMVNGIVTDIVPEVDPQTGVYEINLDTFANNLKLGFSNFTYAITEADAYEYRMDDGDWLPLKNDMSLTFYDLMPGRHNLYVRYSGDSDNPDSEETVVALHIPYPFFWKIGFSVIALLIVLSIFLAWRAVRNHRHLKSVKATETITSAEQNPSGPTDSPKQKKYVSNTLTRNEAREIASKIDEIMRKDKPYLHSDLKVAALAEMIGISSHKLSQFFSQHKDLSFYDYVNKFRVDEFKRMVKEDDVRNLTLSAMAEKAGFSSRASFFRYFKNIEGISPGEYLKSHLKE